MLQVRVVLVNDHLHSNDRSSDGFNFGKVLMRVNQAREDKTFGSTTVRTRPESFSCGGSPIGVVPGAVSTMIIIVVLSFRNVILVKNISARV